MNKNFIRYEVAVFAAVALGMVIFFTCFIGDYSWATLTFGDNPRYQIPLFLLFLVGLLGWCIVYIKEHVLICRLTLAFVALLILFCSCGETRY
jgi:endonuclease/exonuclease/phosphatase (EEP) superfamily protein YafD